MAPQTKRAALYIRVSTTNRSIKNPNVFEQDPSVQELPLRQLAEQRGWTVVRVQTACPVPANPGRGSMP